MSTQNPYAAATVAYVAFASSTALRVRTSPAWRQQVAAHEWDGAPYLDRLNVFGDLPDDGVQGDRARAW